MPDEIVTRLYERLVEALEQRGHPTDQPVKVAEIHEELVPYRRVRTHLGLDLSADYEHALLRLLAGERDLLRVEPAETREELRCEVQAAYPTVGLFRKFPDADVWVAMPPPGTRSPTADPEAAAERAADDRDGSSAERSPAPGAGATGAGEVPAAGGGEREGREGEGHGGAEGGDARGGPGVADAAAHPAGAGCAFCGESLPAGPRVRFCPYCGGDRRLRPCPRCDAVLEREWRFCITCGHDVAGG